jgi:hypothetical protein
VRTGVPRGKYDEFRFFTGLRPSEEIAVQLDDIDLARGAIRVCKARVMMRDKDWTKIGEDRTVELCDWHANPKPPCPCDARTQGPPARGTSRSLAYFVTARAQDHQ